MIGRGPGCPDNVVIFTWKKVYLYLTKLFPVLLGADCTPIDVLAVSTSATPAVLHREKWPDL